MRDYAKVSPKFWTGETGQELARRGSDALVVALYLMTSPHSNMLGLYYQPVLYLAEETGLTPEGASKGLNDCIEAGFCRYDLATKMVWVVEMASYQIGSELSANDKRCKGIIKDYVALPNCPFLGSFFDRYAKAFHLTTRRDFTPKRKALGQNGGSPFEDPSKQGEGTGEGTGDSDPKGSGGKPPVGNQPDKEKAKALLWQAAVSLLAGQGMPEVQARTFFGKLTKDYPDGDVVQRAVEAAVAEQPPDARAYIKAACQRIAGERSRGGTADWTATAI